MQSNEFITVYRQQIKQQYAVYGVFGDISGYEYALKMTCFVPLISICFLSYGRGSMQQ